VSEQDESMDNASARRVPEPLSKLVEGLPTPDEVGEWMEDQDRTRRAAWAVAAGPCTDCDSQVGEECEGGPAGTHSGRIMQYVPLHVLPACEPNDEVIPEGETVPECVMCPGHTDLHLAPTGDRWGEVEGVVVRVDRADDHGDVYDDDIDMSVIMAEGRRVDVVALHEGSFSNDVEVSVECAENLPDVSGVSSTEVKKRDRFKATWANDESPENRTDDNDEGC